MSMNGTDKFRVKFVREDCYGFKNGEIYEAIKAKSKLGGAELFCIKDKSGEEYAYPAEWFEIVEE